MSSKKTRWATAATTAALVAVLLLVDLTSVRLRPAIRTSQLLVRVGSDESTAAESSTAAAAAGPAAAAAAAGLAESAAAAEALLKQQRKAAAGPRAQPAGAGDGGEQQPAKHPKQPSSNANGADELVLPLRPLVWPPLPGNRTHAASKLAILAHFSHDPSWARAMPFPVKVYSSQPGYQAEGLEVVPVEGRGNEARAYLTAILDHWDDMPDAMAFLHSHESSWHTWMGADQSSNSLRLPSLRWPLSEPFMPLSCQTVPLCIRPARDEQYSLGWKEHFQRWFGRLPTVAISPCCSEFLATRAAIQRLPRAFYEDTLRWMEVSAMKDPGWIFEYLWQVFFSVDHGSIWPWGFMPRACLCFLYNQSCEAALNATKWEFEC